MILEKLTLILALTATLAFAIDYQSLGTEPHFKPSADHYLDFPLMRKDFTHWATVGAAVMLKSKLVLSPEVKDKRGILYSTRPNTLERHWMLDVELDMANEAKSARGGTGLALFYARSIDQVSHRESIFGYSNRFEGLGIYLNTIVKSDTRGANKSILNAIQGFVNDGTRGVNVFTDKKHMCYRQIRNLPEGQPLRLRVIYDAPLLTMQTFDHEMQAFDLCFSFEVDLTFQGHFLLSGASGVHNPDHIYINSVKVYDPLNKVANDHFQEVRRKKAEAEAQEAGRDLLENHRPVLTRNVSELYSIIPQQHHRLNQRLQEVVTDLESGSSSFFETLKSLPPNIDYVNVKEKLYIFKLQVDALNAELEKESAKLAEYDKLVRSVRYSANLQRGLQRREVINADTQKAHGEIQEVLESIRAMTIFFGDYKQSIETLGTKIKQEEGFTSRLEAQRRQFAQDQASSLSYDLREIDDFFNAMELDVLQTGVGWGTWGVRAGMVLVTVFSIVLWFKMNRYEVKNE